MYSALKRDGQPLYRLARAGRDAWSARRAHRHSTSMQLLEWLLARRSSFDVLCSKGTYVRVLAEDMARRSGLRAPAAAAPSVASSPFAHEPM